MFAQNLFFGLLAAAMAVSAIKLVTTKNVVHAALYLVIVLSGMAGQYILLAAEFVAEANSQLRVVDAAVDPEARVSLCGEFGLEA